MASSQSSDVLAPEDNATQRRERLSQPLRAVESTQQPALSKRANRSLLRSPSSHLLADNVEKYPTESCSPVTGHVCVCVHASI